jgi:hypothetical protein
MSGRGGGRSRPAAALKGAGRAVLTASTPEGRDPNPRGDTDTVILRGLLERLDEAPAHAVLESAWECVRPGGRMIVVVPNEHLASEAGTVREFKRRSLRRELRFLGRPRLSPNSRSAGWS